MIVCITEKPSVARDLAHVIGANSKRDGFFEGNGYQVTWALGHLCCLKEPEDYLPEWKKWNMNVLPMIPNRFSIKLIDNPGVKKQFKVIERLFKNADCIVNCGDAGQEGELIQRWILQLCMVKCPVKRLWISSLTDAAIREGFRNLKPQSDYDKLYMAGLARACGDWLLGINATRLFTMKYGNNQVLSIGRVQTPTLSLIVNRDREIKNFKPEKFYVLSTVYKGVTFKCSHGNFTSREECMATLNDIKGKPFAISNVEKKDGRESPPQLFDLTSLQVECNRRYGWSAEYTLNTLQSLYEKKLTSYPRVDTRFLPDDIYPKCQGILRGLNGHRDATTPLLSCALRKSKRVFDSSKITDHHAIIPTGMSPHDLSRQQETLFDLIAVRFISCFYPDCLFYSTTITGSVNGCRHSFLAKGKTIKSPGWRGLMKNNDSDEKEENENKVIPPFSVGESGCHSPKMEEKLTQPPKPFTEGSLLQAMETAGKFVTDETIKEALKENGIGRPSSRASIIETLFKRNYISRVKKDIMPTQTGIDLIDTIKVDLLKSCELTGIWEKKLRDIENGSYDPTAFINELKTMLAAIVTSVKNDDSGRFVARSEQPHGNGKKTAYRQGKGRNKKK